MNDKTKKSVDDAVHEAADSPDEQVASDAVHAESVNTPVTVDDESLLTDIGHRLCKARRACGESLDDLVRELKLRKVYLQALEKGDWNALPDKVYAVGFLRQYAAHLKLDLDDEINHIKSRQYKLTRPLTFPDPPIAPSRRWAWIAGICFVVLFIAFNVFNYEDNDSASDVPLTSLAVQPEQRAATPVSDPNADTEVSLVEPDAATRTSEPIKPTSSVQPSNDSEAPLTTVANSLAPPVAAILPLHRYRFEAVGDAVWLQVYLPDASGQSKGEMRKEVLLQAGHQFVLNEPVKQMWVTTGNAGALQISVDGNIIDGTGTLGKIGQVLHDHQISAP